MVQWYIKDFPIECCKNIKASKKKEGIYVKNLLRVTSQFLIQGKVISIEKIKKGYINSTYKVETLSIHNHVHKYILQRINTNVFPDVQALMKNFILTTECLYNNLKLPGKHTRGTVQCIRPTKDGKLFLEDENGSWRMLTYFDNVYSLDIPDNA